MIQAATDRHLWAESYERDLSNVLALESEVARAIASEIRVKVTPQEKVQLTSARAVNPEAFQLYLQGRYYWNKRTGEGFHKAIDYFNQAIEKDPNYALAYGGLADSYAGLGEYKLLPAKEAFPRAREAVERALELDETLAEAHTTLAEIKESYDWDWPGAGREFRRAIELNPGYPSAHQWYSAFLSFQGRHEEALAEGKRAQELDPLSLIINMDMGQKLTYAGQPDSAVEQLRKTVEMDTNFAQGHYAFGKAYLRKGNFAEAIVEFQKARTLSPNDTRYAGALGHAYARAGRNSEARKVLNELMAQSERRYVSWYSIACIYAGLEEKDEAFASLGKAYEQHDTGLVHLKVEPLLDPLRSDPRFQDLLRRVGLPP